MAPLKVLVLHPAFSSDEAWKRATGSIHEHLERDGLAELHYGRAPVEVELPSFINPELWYDRPYLRWFAVDSILDPRGTFPAHAEATALATIQAEFDTHGGFDVIYGYSEGSLTASAFLFRQWQSMGRLPVKAAIFIGGSPPCVRADDGGTEIVDPDGIGQIFAIDTLHIVGSLDPNLDRSVALYRMCDPKRARMWDTGKGHVLPHTPKTSAGVAKVVRKFLEDVSARNRERDI